MDREEQITQKYQRAFQEMERRQVRVTETRMQGEKLYVLAYAPSEDAKNKVWDQIKAVDPSYSDLICDIRVGEAQGAGSAHRDFDQAVQSAGPGALARGLSSAFKSDQTPPFSQMLGHLFSHSNGEQRAGLLNHIFSITPSSLASEVLGMVGGKKQVTPEEAQKISPEAVQQLAAKAEQHDPSVIDRVSEFYSQHPAVVKTLGVGALTAVVSRMLHRSRGGA